MRASLFATLLLVGTAHAGPLEDSATLNDEGKALYAARDYPGAVAKFKAAWALSRQPRYMFNLASVLDDMGRNAEAIDAYEQHLRHPDTKPDDQTAIWATKRVAALEPKVGRVHIMLGRTDATLDVQGRTIDIATPVLDVRVDPGMVPVVGRAGDRSHSLVVEIKVGETVEVDLTAQLAPPAPPAPTPPIVDPDPSPPRRLVLPVDPPEPEAPAPAWRDPLTLSLVGASVLALGVGSYFWYASSSDEDDLASQPNLPSHDALLDRARDRRLYAQISLAASVAFAGGALLRYALVRSTRTTTVAVQPGASGSMVTFSSRF